MLFDNEIFHNGHNGMDLHRFIKKYFTIYIIYLVSINYNK